jgi:DNA polymerase III gamma/tau subunit
MTKMDQELHFPVGIDLDTAKDILDDMNIEYRIAILKIDTKEDLEEILNSVDQIKAATLVNFWQQVYFDWFNF